MTCGGWLSGFLLGEELMGQWEVEEAIKEFRVLRWRLFWWFAGFLKFCRTFLLNFVRQVKSRVSRFTARLFLFTDCLFLKFDQVVHWLLDFIARFSTLFWSLLTIFQQSRVSLLVLSRNPVKSHLSGSWRSSPRLFHPTLYSPRLQMNPSRPPLIMKQSFSTRPLYEPSTSFYFPQNSHRRQPAAMITPRFFDSF
jgi:hypothetical protein